MGIGRASHEHEGRNQGDGAPKLGERQRKLTLPGDLGTNTAICQSRAPSLGDGKQCISVV